MSIPDIHNILKQYWGYDAFRPVQEEVIRSVLEGKDTLALLPTGGGKSLCFQVPALAKEGICIVISPLIALMKDQVENLRARNIKAEAIYSGMSKREIDRILDNCVYGDNKFLYVSPERITTDLFKERVKRMKVNLLAVDEAHCISQWGYDFRPEYLLIAELRPLLKNIPVLALTASATAQVVDDMQQRLLFPATNVFRKSFERKNLHYHVRVLEDKNAKLIEVCHKLAGTGIVYVRNRRAAKELANLLQRNKVSADFYHAGLTHKEREQKQNNWKQNKTRVMVCTNAFGMGIDKPDVRFVVHYEIPDGPESYYQEAGRAGRDEEKAFAVLLYNQADRVEAEMKLKQSIPLFEDVKRVYNALGSYLNIATGAGEFQTFPFDLAQFAVRFKIGSQLAYNCLKTLEQEGYIKLSDAIHEPSRAMIVVNNAELYKFQVAHASHDTFIKMMLRLYGGLFDGYVRIHEEDMAAKLKTSAADVVKTLKQLQQYNLIDYIEQTDLPKITYLKERFETSNLRINAKQLRFREEVQTGKLQAILGYAEQMSLCRSKYLLHYFDETNVVDCGVCDVCLLKTEHDLGDEEIEQLLKKIKEALTQQPLDTQSLVKALRLKDKKVLAVLEVAVEHQLVSRDYKGLLNWNNGKG